MELYDITACIIILSYLLTIPKYYLGWYITYQMIWYLIYYASMRFINNRKVRYFMWIIIGLCILSSDSMLYARQSFSFMTGVFLSDFQNVGSKLCKKRYIMLIGIVGILLLAIKQISVFRTTPIYAQNSLDMLMVTCIGLCLIFGLSQIKQIALTPFYWMGIISYELYLLHGYTLWLVDLTFVNAVLFYILTIGCAVLSHLVLASIKNNIIQKVKG